MELGTFGAVFTFAIHLEENSAQFYEDAVGVLESLEAKKLFSSLGAGARKRKKKVERARQEFVREAILVHVTGLSQNDYLIELESLHGMKEHQILEAALAIEKNRQRFYNNASKKIGQPDVSRTFKRLAKENSNHKLKLEALL